VIYFAIDMKIPKGFVLICIFLLLSGAALFSLSLPWLEAEGGLLYLGNGYEEGGPSPLLQSFGASVNLSFGGHFFLAPSLIFSGTQYQKASAIDKTLPTEIEFADSVWYLSMFLNIHAGWNFPFQENLSAGFTLFPSFLFRMPVRSWGTYNDDPELKKPLTSYFYQQGRLFYPGISGYFHWKMFESLGLSVRTAALFPVFHFWDGELRVDGERVPFYDQMMVSLSFGVRYYFR